MTTSLRKIGNDQVTVPGLGCMGMSAFYQGSGHDEENIKTLKVAYDAGERFWDTSDVYFSTKGPGENERLIAQAIKEQKLDRSKIFIATKFAMGPNEDGSFYIRGDPKYVEEASARSLKNLDTEFIDLYYQHRVDPKTPIEDTVRAMDKLRKEGKVKHIGLSECSAETLRKANKVAKIDALQVEYSLWETGPETNGLLDACKELGIALIAYSPLGRGFLSGRYKSPDDFDDNDFRKHAPRFSKEHFGKNLELVSEIDKLAKKKGCTPSQLALAWVHAQWEGIIAIPGTTNVDRLKENLGSNNVDLSKEELSEIREILNKFPPVGERYNEAFMSMVNL